jgi:hypothetical protein
MTHWGIYAIASFVLLGIMPFLFPPYFKGPSLNIYNWIFLGVTGAILYTVNHMKSLDTTKVGEDEGSLELRRMLLGIIIGIASAVLLYVTLKGEILGGKIFPDNFTNNTEAQASNSINNALSVFWGIFSGFSMTLVGRLMETAETSISSSNREGNPSERNIS